MITLAARALNSICIQRILGVLEERAKQQRNLPMMISLGDLGKRAGRAENVAPMLKKGPPYCRAVGLPAASEQQTAWQPPIRLHSPGDASE